MEKIDAYQASDGKKFFKKEEAKDHEDRLRYKSKVKEIENYLCDLLKIERPDGSEDGEGIDEQLFNILEGQSKSSLSDFIDAIQDLGIEEMVNLIIDIATIADGALLKTAQYARELTSPDKNRPEDRKIDRIMDILLDYDRDISNGYDFGEDAEDMLKPVAEKILKAIEIASLADNK